MKRRLQKGAAAIELALVLPWLLLMIDGVAELGVLIYNQSVLVSGSSMAARAGIAGGSDKLTIEQVRVLAYDYCNTHLMMVDNHTPIVVDVVQAAAPVFQLPLRVTVHYTYQGLLIGTFLSALQLQPAMQATTVMYNE
jgi:Flp pilus assembly protein TadG